MRISVAVRQLCGCGTGPPFACVRRGVVMRA